MDIPLLKTKLNMPVPRESIVHRPRLFDKLNSDLKTGDGFARRLTLISAPAGYGKTSLAVEWLGNREEEVLWLSLDEEDNDQAHFLAYLVAAFQQADPEIGVRTLQMLQSPQPPQAETLVTVLINDLSATHTPLILTLDDYHFIQNPMVHEIVGFLLENQPSQFHQVVLTREDPLLPVARLLSRGQASEIRQQDLRFTLAESTRFLNRSMGLNLTPEDLDALQRRTEGWVAGLQFAGLSMQGRSDLHQFVKNFAGSNRYILDYLFEEVFSLQGPEVQEFLINTSILTRLTADLCNAVVDRRDSQDLLESLEKANMFIVPLGLSREWYRYHGLFRDLLRHRLQKVEVGEVSAIHLRASQWYESRDLPADAVQHALAAQEWARASQLVLSVSELMMKRGEIVTLLDWFGQFPDEVIRSDLGLCIDYIWTLILAGQNEFAESLLVHVEALTADMPEYHFSIYSARAYLARTKGNISETIEMSERALELIPVDDKSTRGILAINLGIAYWHKGQMDQASQALIEAQKAAQETGNVYAQMTAIVFLARVQAVGGNLRQAAGMLEGALDKGGNAPIIGLAHLDLGYLHYEWNDLKACREHLLQGQKINQSAENIEYLVRGYMLETRLMIAQGNLRAAAKSLENLQEMIGAGELPKSTRSRIISFQIEMALRLGDLPGAQQSVTHLNEDLDAHPFYRFFGLTEERLLIAAGEKERSARQLRAKRDTAEQAGWKYGGIAIRILEAIAAEDEETRLSVLIDALEQSGEGGYLRAFADHGPILVDGLMEAARRGVNPEYVGQILAVIRQETEQKVASEEVMEPLSEREVEVLRLVAAGLSNREIADKLYLSPGTIKTHVHNICGKLGANNRTQAVGRARDLGLI
jgi:LuxR family maltose regulon positive regulatory protein